MPTNNPKVSAYVPQNVFDHFQSFCKEKKISMSQAVAVIFAEYFEIEPQMNSSSGLLLGRIKDLEMKVNELMSLKSEAIQTQVNLGKIETSSLSELVSSLEVKSYEDGVVVYNGQENSSELNNVLLSKPESEMRGSIQPKLSNNVATAKEDLSELSSSLLNEQKNEQQDLRLRANDFLEIVKPETKKESELSEVLLTTLPSTIFDLDSIVSDGLTVLQLAERFESRATNISSQKSKLRSKPEKFIEWTKKQDPDGCGWEFRDESTLFYRVQETTSLSEGEVEAQSNHP